MANSTTNLDTISATQAQKEVAVNELMDAASAAVALGRHASACVGLTWGYYGGTIVVGDTPTQIANGTVSLTASNTNYIYLDSSGDVVCTTSPPSGWPGPLAGDAYALYSVVAGSSSVTSYTDYRVALASRGPMGATGPEGPAGPAGSDGAPGPAGSGLPHTCTGRLTLTSGTAVTTSDVTGATTIYFTPFRGAYIGVYDGATWEVIGFSETSLALGTLSSDKNYDVFAYNGSSALELELSAAWSSDTARTDALAYQDGVLVKSADHTRRYLGTFRTTSTTQTEDSDANRYLWNYTNRVKRRGLKSSSSAHDYATNSWRMWNNSAANCLNFVSGYAEDAIPATLQTKVMAKASASGYYVGTQLDASSGSTVGADCFYYFTLPGSGYHGRATGSTIYAPQIGKHTVNVLENSISAGNGSYDDYALYLDLMG